MDKKPRYSPGQSVKILHDWAKDIPPKVIENVIWDEHWNCYTYALIGGLIRIEEHELALAMENNTDGEPALYHADQARE